MATVTAIAPGRVNLIGEHTDYNGGLCLPFAIPLATTATVTERSDDQLRLISDRAEPWSGTLADIERRTVPGWSAYVAGVLWALGHRDTGLDVEITSTIPLGGGLASSAALECSVAVAISGLRGHPLDDEGRMALAEACHRAETEYVGAPTGGLDQLASLLGESGRGILIDFATPEEPVSEMVPLELAAAGLGILVTDTGSRHTLADGESGYARRRAECEALAADHATMDPVLIARGRHVQSENARVRAAVDAVQTADWPMLGSLLTTSHASLRDDFEVSCPELDAAVDAALVGGALGARMTGGGFGGCSIALVAVNEVDVVRGSIDRIYAERHWPSPQHHLVQPAGGARLVVG